jgi:glycosyltransferase involved in cell wall biosynthesis
MSKYYLTIVTVVHNNLDGLISIYNDLYILFDGRLQWVIKDSGFSDGIIDWFNSLNNPYVELIVGIDSGIYDALNITLDYVMSDYYLVIGSDDRIIPSNLIEIVSALEVGRYQNFDFICFPVMIGGTVFNRKTCIPISWSISSLVSSHSCGLIIKKSIHGRLGLYSTEYKILSDSLFILLAHKGLFNFYYEKLPIGIFGTDGISSTLSSTRAKESFKLQLEAGSSFFLQLVFYMMRIFLLKIKILINLYK